MRIHIDTPITTEGTKPTKSIILGAGASNPWETDRGQTVADWSAEVLAKEAGARKGLEGAITQLRNAGFEFKANTSGSRCLRLSRSQTKGLGRIFSTGVGSVLNTVQMNVKGKDVTIIRPELAEQLIYGARLAFVRGDAESFDRLASFYVPRSSTLFGGTNLVSIGSLVKNDGLLSPVAYDAISSRHLLQRVTRKPIKSNATGPGLDIANTSTGWILSYRNPNRFLHDLHGFVQGIKQERGLDIGYLMPDLVGLLGTFGHANVILEKDRFGQPWVYVAGPMGSNGDGKPLPRQRGGGEIGDRQLPIDTTPSQPPAFPQPAPIRLAEQKPPVNLVKEVEKTMSMAKGEPPQTPAPQTGQSEDSFAQALAALEEMKAGVPMEVTVTKGDTTVTIRPAALAVAPPITPAPPLTAPPQAPTITPVPTLPVTPQAPLPPPTVVPPSAPPMSDAQAEQAVQAAVVAISASLAERQKDARGFGRKIIDTLSGFYRPNVIGIGFARNSDGKTLANSQGLDELVSDGVAAEFAKRGAGVYKLGEEKLRVMPVKGTGTSVVIRYQGTLPLGLKSRVDAQVPVLRSFSHLIAKIDTKLPEDVKSPLYDEMSKALIGVQEEAGKSTIYRVAGTVLTVAGILGMFTLPQLFVPLAPPTPPKPTNSRNHNPIIASVADQYVEFGQTLELPFNVTDPDGDNVTLGLQNVTPGAHFQGNRLYVQSFGVGDYVLTVTATDGKGGFAQRDVKLFVTPKIPISNGNHTGNGNNTVNNIPVETPDNLAPIMSQLALTREANETRKNLYRLLALAQNKPNDPTPGVGGFELQLDGQFLERVTTNNGTTLEKLFDFESPLYGLTVGPHQLALRPFDFTNQSIIGSLSDAQQFIVYKSPTITFNASAMQQTDVDIYKPAGLIVSSGSENVKIKHVRVLGPQNESLLDYAADSSVVDFATVQEALLDVQKYKGEIPITVIAENEYGDTATLEARIIAQDNLPADIPVTVTPDASLARDYFTFSVHLPTDVDDANGSLDGSVQFLSTRLGLSEERAIHVGERFQYNVSLSGKDPNVPYDLKVIYRAPNGQTRELWNGVLMAMNDAPALLAFEITGNNTNRPGANVTAADSDTPISLEVAMEGQAPVSSGSAKIGESKVTAAFDAEESTPGRYHVTATVRDAAGNPALVQSQEVVVPDDPINLTRKTALYNPLVQNGGVIAVNVSGMDKDTTYQAYTFRLLNAVGGVVKTYDKVQLPQPAKNISVSASLPTSQAEVSDGNVTLEMLLERQGGGNETLVIKTVQVNRQFNIIPKWHDAARADGELWVGGDGKVYLNLMDNATLEQEILNDDKVATPDVMVQVDVQYDSVIKPHAGDPWAVVQDMAIIVSSYSNGSGASDTDTAGRNITVTDFRIGLARAIDKIINDQSIAQADRDKYKEFTTLTVPYIRTDDLVELANIMTFREAQKAYTKDVMRDYTILKAGLRAVVTEPTDYESKLGVARLVRDVRQSLVSLLDVENLFPEQNYTNIINAFNLTPAAARAGGIPSLLDNPDADVTFMGESTKARTALLRLASTVFTAHKSGLPVTIGYSGGDYTVTKDN